MGPGCIQERDGSAGSRNDGLLPVFQHRPHRTPELLFTLVRLVCAKNNLYFGKSILHNPGILFDEGA